MNREDLLLSMYNAMLDTLGPSGWWPGETPFEVAVGAVLTQNTAWSNVEKAVGNLRAAGALSPREMEALAADDLARLIRPSGYYRVKALRLKALLAFLREECGHDLAALAERDTDDLRNAVLGVKGVGPETADSILLYALEKPSFVVDAYTKRILSRHALIPEDAGYDEMREFFMDVLPHSVELYNEYHALIVRVGKQFCASRSPRCESCPLQPFLER
ncbi:endonuclease III domain-containing protein [Desulfocurvus sp. DL9XJH121]